MESSQSHTFYPHSLALAFHKQLFSQLFSCTLMMKHDDLDHRVAITLEKSIRKNICLEKDQDNEMPVQWKICLEVIGC